MGAKSIGILGEGGQLSPRFIGGHDLRNGVVRGLHKWESNALGWLFWTATPLRFRHENLLASSHPQTVWWGVCVCVRFKTTHSMARTQDNGKPQEGCRKTNPVPLITHTQARKSVWLLPSSGGQQHAQCKLACGGSHSACSMNLPLATGETLNQYPQPPIAGNPLHAPRLPSPPQPPTRDGGAAGGGGCLSVLALVRGRNRIPALHASEAKGTTLGAGGGRSAGVCGRQLPLRRWQRQRERCGGGGAGAGAAQAGGGGGEGPTTPAITPIAVAHPAGGARGWQRIAWVSR
jgi:hypothetical protein